MGDVKGLLRVRVRRGINLVAKDSNSSDPYVLITMDSQKVKTRAVKNSCNPEWNDELTLAISDPDLPINLTVYDKDTFTADDKMGEAEIDIKPYLDCLKMELESVPNGTVVGRIHPNMENCLADESQIVWKDGKLIQDMVLRLKTVPTGQVDLQLEWLHIHNP